MNIPLQLASVTTPKKKSFLNKIPFIILAIFILVNLIGLYYGNILYKKATTITIGKETNQYDKYKSTFDERRYNRLYKRDITLTSIHGYKLTGTYIECDGDSKNTMILVHDLNGSRWSVMKYADMYLSKGFNVLVYDARGHENSGGNGTTLGYEEQDDLQSWVEYISTWNKYGIIGVHGEGFGAFTALLHSQINKEDKKVDFYILDSSFTDVQAYLTLVANKDLNIKNPYLVKPLTFYANVVNFFKSGFILSNISAVNSVQNVSTPMLFIHGKNDPVIPEAMTEALYKAKENNKQLYITNSSNHDNSYIDNVDQYQKKVFNFIDGILSKYQ